MFRAEQGLLKRSIPTGEDAEDVWGSQALHLGLLSLAGFSAVEEELLLFRMANLAPATACGLSLPVNPLFDFGWGSRLIRREAASELDGRGVVSGDGSLILGGCSEARLVARLVDEVCGPLRDLVRDCIE